MKFLISALLLVAVTYATQPPPPELPKVFQALTCLKNNLPINQLPSDVYGVVFNVEDEFKKKLPEIKEMIDYQFQKLLPPMPPKGGQLEKLDQPPVPPPPPPPPGAIVRCLIKLLPQDLEGKLEFIRNQGYPEQFPELVKKFKELVPQMNEVVKAILGAKPPPGK